MKGKSAIPSGDDSWRMTGNPWDRLENESQASWEAFKIYRDMGLTRSIPKVAQQLEKPRTTLGSWSVKNSWLMRAAAFDAEQDSLDQLWLAQERRKAAKRHVQQAQALSSKWIQRLQSLNPEDLSASEVIRYAEIATKMERDALRLTEPDTVVNVHLPMVDSLSFEDTRLRLEVLQKEIAARMKKLGEDVVEAEVVEDE
jgi:hypothetical protein